MRATPESGTFSRLLRTLGRATLYGCGTALLASLPALAQPPISADNGPPIRIERCAVLGRSVLLDPFNGLRSQVAAATEVRFVNRRRSAATQVTLTVRYQGTTSTTVETGRFEPGVPIARELATFEGVPFGGERADCQVTAASFSDASTWSDRP